MTKVNYADGSTEYTNTGAQTDNDSQDQVVNAATLIGDAAYNAADNANGNIAATIPSITGYVGR